MYQHIEIYKDFEITCCAGLKIFTVVYNGDEVAFHTIDEARAFIDEVA